MDTFKWRIIARHKWIDGATITESIRRDNPMFRRFTATIFGYQRWRIWTGNIAVQGMPFVVVTVFFRVAAIKARIRVFSLIPNYLHGKIEGRLSGKVLLRLVLLHAKNEQAEKRVAEHLITLKRKENKKMAILDSPYWDLKLGICEKHYLPAVPCPQCIATLDKDIEVVPTLIEREGWVEISIPIGFENHQIRS